MDPYYVLPYEYDGNDNMNLQSMLPMPEMQTMPQITSPGSMGMPNMQNMPDMMPQPMMPNMQEMPSMMPQTTMPNMQNFPNMMQQPTMPNMQNFPNMMQQPIMPNMQNFPNMMPNMQNLPDMMPNMQNMPDMMPQVKRPPQNMTFADMYEESMLSDNVPVMLTFDSENSYRPQPVLSNNPATARIVLFKELTGYPNYGNPSGNADILYTGNRGTWTFDIPGILAMGEGFNGQLVIRAVLDDSDTQINLYSANITINGRTVHTGRLPLVHGRPFGQRFDTWRPLTFNVPNLRRNNRIVIVNTSTGNPNNWIGLDWMELRVIR